MIVRCGRCGNGFQVPGEGRHVCPSCGTVNEVRAPQGPGAEPGPEPSPHPRPPERSYPRVTCTSCGFSFIVGEVESAPCPNCGTSVTVVAGKDEAQ